MSHFDVNLFLKAIENELEFSFARASGPGGQNVNKVQSKATLKWDVCGCTKLPEGIKQRFQEHFPGRITKDGILILSCEEFRDQTRNVSLCRQKLTKMLEEVRRPPKPRRATKPTRGSVERRLLTKSRQSQRKRNRVKISDS